MRAGVHGGCTRGAGVTGDAVAGVVQRRQRQPRATARTVEGFGRAQRRAARAPPAQRVPAAGAAHVCVRACMQMHVCVRACVRVCV